MHPHCKDSPIGGLIHVCIAGTSSICPSAPGVINEESVGPHPRVLVLEGWVQMAVPKTEAGARDKGPKSPKVRVPKQAQLACGLNPTSGAKINLSARDDSM